LYNANKSKVEWENRAGSMTLWEDAHSHDASVCGRYLSYWDIHTMMMNNHMHVLFSVTIGFDDLLVFQAFELFPSCALGTLELVIWVSADAMVYCCVDPKVTIPEYLERGNMNPREIDGDREAHDRFLKEGLTDDEQKAGHSNNLFLYRAVHDLMPFNSDCYYDRRFTQVRQPARVATNIFPIRANAGYPLPRGLNGFSYG
jgi:hypothetical protein